jgi:hypothetical protein
MHVRETLSLDVTWLVEVALNKALAATECSDGFAHCRFVKFRNFFERARDLEATTATAEGCLDGNWQAELLRERNDFVCALDWVRSAWNLWSTGACGNVAGRNLVAETANGIW